VRNRYVWPVAALVLSAFASVPAWPQDGQILPELRGELKGTAEVVFHGYVVELYDWRSHQNFGRTDVQSTGAFTFRNVPNGDYVLRVTDMYGEVLQEENVSVSSRGAPIIVRLNQEREARPASGSVSIRQLQHPPSTKAVSAFIAAQRFSESHQPDKAAAELEKAIRISPDYAEAHTNLAAQYMRLGRFEDGLAETARALAIAGPNPRDLGNQAFAQWALHRYPEALSSASQSLQLAPNNAYAHYIVGAILAMDRRTLRDSVSHMEIAAQSIPSAREGLDKIRAALRSAP
jgi:tetratricopeptide (TPR) repeat protein